VNFTPFHFLSRAVWLTRPIILPNITGYSGRRYLTSILILRQGCQTLRFFERNKFSFTTIVMDIWEIKQATACLKSFSADFFLQIQSFFRRGRHALRMKSLSESCSEPRWIVLFLGCLYLFSDDSLVSTHFSTLIKLQMYRLFIANIGSFSRHSWHLSHSQVFSVIFEILQLLD